MVSHDSAAHLEFIQRLHQQLLFVCILALVDRKRVKVCGSADVKENASSATGLGFFYWAREQVLFTYGVPHINSLLPHAGDG
jgi:hypothetical protein